jgi:hypothetical protein
MKKVKEAYDEILKALHKHREICVFDVSELERKAKTHLFGLELKEVYGLNIDSKQIKNMDWVRFGEYRAIGMWGEKHRRTIIWSVDGIQPEDEMLLQICFPTGAYIFGEDYAVNFFQKFWLELKSFTPDYIDEVNLGLYWKLENAKDVFNSFDLLLKKYYELNKEDAKQRRIEKMKKELEQLENSK